MRQETGDPITVKAAVDAPRGLNVRIRRVGYVPVPHHNTSVLDDPLEMDGLGHIPGYVPDPLFDEDAFTLPSHETHVFWFTVTPKRTVAPGTYPIMVSVTSEKDGRTRKTTAEVTLHSVKLKQRTDFAVTNWFYVDAIIDWYGTDQFDERYADKTDMPIPSIKTFAQFLEAGVPSWCYYCCHPRDEWLNRLMDTPLPKMAMHGFLFYRWPALGFLHWGYNYWYKSQTRELVDPFTVSDGGKWSNWAYGDTFQVYPGPDGPIDSIRWEIFAESLQDYCLLQTLGIDREDPRLASMKSFKTFPKPERWRKQFKRQLLVDQKRVINGRN